MTGSNDRRLEARFPLTLQAHFQNPLEYLASWTENISAGGIFIRTDAPLSVGDTVRVALSFPGLLEAVEIMGVVTWTRAETVEQPRGVGLRVIGDPDRRKLAELAVLAIPPKEDTTNLPPFRVLVAEDNPLVSRMYARALRHFGSVISGSVQVSFATNGHEAIKAIRENPPHLLITDLYMPVVDGVELVKAVRSQPLPQSHLPILMVTCGPEEERERANEAGVDAFLRKPVQLGLILETIVHLLHAKQAVTRANKP